MAIEKAKASATPAELPPGHYEVILEPAAVRGLLGPLMWSLSARDYHKGSSALAGKLGERILDERLWISSDPAHEDLLGRRFNGAGLPYRRMNWVEGGVLKNLSEYQDC